MAKHDDIEFVDDLDDDLDDLDEVADDRPAATGGDESAPKRPHRGKRPGEQDPLQSPLVLMLGGGSLVLMLVAATLWFVIGRHFRQEAFDKAQAEMSGKRYRQAITGFEAFLDEHPRGDLAEKARLELSRAAVLREISGATPTWAEGLTALETFIDTYRDREEFTDLKSEVFDYAKTIALGSAKEAERSTDRKYLEVFEKARRLAARYVSESETEELESQLDSVYEKADAAIHKRETYDAALAKMREALEADAPIDALAERRGLLDRYGDFETDPDLVELTASVLEAERGRTTAEQLDVAPITEQPPTSPAVALLAHTRATTDRPVGTRCVIAVAGGTCFGADAATGTPRWRYDLGRVSRFFPVNVEVGAPGLLAFDDLRSELVHLERDTGRVVWRSPIGSPATTSPLVVGGMVLLVTDDAIHRIDLGTGRRTARVAFTQPITTQPAAADDGRIVVAGERGVIYLLDPGTLECGTTIHFGHRPGAIVRLMAMGPYLVVFENDRRDGSRFGLYTLGDGKRPLELIAEDRLQGLVFDEPAIRGSRLLVPFGRERVAAYTVSAEEGQQPLVRVADLDAEGERGPMFLLPAPSDEFWMADTALRRYRVTGADIQTVPGEAASGDYTQPLQLAGENLFVARRPGFAESIFFSQLEGRTFTGEWRVVLADRIAATMPGAGDTLVCATAAGSIFRVPRARFGEGGFVAEPAFTIPVGDGSEAPLQIASAPPNAIAVAGANRDGEPRLWVLNRAGIVDWQVEIPSVAECPPAPLMSGFVVAVPGRLTMSTRNRALIGAYEPENEAPWLKVAAISKDTVVAQDADGRLVRVQYRASPRGHLAEAGSATLANPTPFAFDFADGRIAVAEPTTLTIFDAGSLGRVADLPLAEPPAKAPWFANGLVLVESRRGTLTAFDPDGRKQAWSLNLDGSSLAGRPVVMNGTLTLALRDGRVWEVGVANGEVTSKRDVGGAFDGDPVRIGEAVLLPTRDGSLFVLGEGES